MSKVKTKIEEQEYNDKSRSIYFIFFIVMLILVSIAYAAIAINLGVPIKGIAEVEDLNWNIEFANLEIDKGSIKPIVEATIDESKTGINYVINLKQPGDYYSFKVDVINSGTVDAKIFDIVNIDLTPKQKKYLEYEIKYEDGTVPKKDEVLERGTIKNLIVEIRFKEDLTASDLPSSYQDLNLSYKLIYVEK